MAIKTCDRGHEFEKSSNCPVCPVCWSSYYREKNKGDFPDKLGAPALRALLSAEIFNLKLLSKYSEKEILDLHGMGPSSILILKKGLKSHNLDFKKNMAKSDVDEYIKKQPKEAQEVLKRIRKIIREVVPEATEGISYGIPAVYLNGKYLVYFAGFKNHVSVYPATSDAVAKAELSDYKVSKSTLRFPFDKQSLAYRLKPIPYENIKKFVEFRVKELTLPSK